MSETNWGNYSKAYKAIHDAIHGLRSVQNVSVTRNEAGYITELELSDGEVTKTVTVVRNSANLIEQILENIS
ncbi:MAG: hypothetical protein NWF04_01990 [Candidatus Bathyarchaeota archaeon]|nr:hypothetical protein [Candidatus Bathyarchaeota archaeon]